jgi:hypothetical protein
MKLWRLQNSSIQEHSLANSPPPDMSNRLEALRVFCTAADAANFREAAVRLSVSPQVVTRAVRELEEELGEPLFHRSTRGVQLTDFGRPAGAARAHRGGRRRRALSPHRPARALAARGHGAGHGAQRVRPAADPAGARARAGRAPGPGARPAPVGAACRRGRPADRHRRARRTDPRRALRGAHGRKDAAARGGRAVAARAHRRAEAASTRSPRCRSPR